MLSSRSRTSYICTQCRTRLTHNLHLPRRALLRIPSTTRLSFPATRRTLTTSTYSPPTPKPREDDVKWDVDDMMSNLVNNTFGAWTKFGLRPVVADTLLRAYPNAARPTSIQKKMLTALTYGYSVAARGNPATGKSFAIAAWLLGMERAMRHVEGAKGKTAPTTSALVLVPNVDLAIQYYETLIRMLNHSNSELLRSSPDAFVQVLYRKSNEMELEQLVRLQRFPHPHIIIAPPTILLDILADKDETVRNLLDIANLKTIVLEEIDASITKLQFFSKMKKTKRTGAKSWENKQVPLQILLDYIIKRRLTDARKAGKTPEQPQLVFPTATLSTAQIKRFLLIWHRDWLDTAELSTDTARSFNTHLPGEEWKRRARSNSILGIEDPPLSHDKITDFVADNLHHHIVAYNIRTRTLRNAPVPRFTTRDRETLNSEIVALARSYKKSHDDADFSLDTWNEEAEPNKFLGYPEDIALDALQQLLKHDNYPRNVIAVLGSEANMIDFRKKAAELGITAKPLLAKKWYDDAEIGSLPLGRTDMLLDRETRERVAEEGKGGDKSKTTVWLSNFFFCRGLDTPGVNHLYILHRMDRAREYITYAGRVARWPYANHVDEIKDPRSYGKDRRVEGKVVNVILEEPAGKGEERWGGRDVEKEAVVLKCDGSRSEKAAWAAEGIRLAKIGCTVEPYFPIEGDAAAEENVEGEKVKAEGTMAGTEELQKQDMAVPEDVVKDAEEEREREQKKPPAFLIEALGMLDEASKKKEGGGEKGE